MERGSRKSSGTNVQTAGYPIIRYQAAFLIYQQPAFCLVYIRAVVGHLPRKLQFFFSFHQSVQEQNRSFHVYASFWIFLTFPQCFVGCGASDSCKQQLTVSLIGPKLKRNQHNVANKEWLRFKRVRTVVTLPPSFHSTMFRTGTVNLRFTVTLAVVSFLKPQNAAQLKLSFKFVQVLKHIGEYGIQILNWRFGRIVLFQVINYYRLRRIQKADLIIIKIIILGIQKNEILN